MSSALKLARDEEGEDVDSKLYRVMIGSLLYLTASRPDLSFSHGVYARYQANPKVSHLNDVKKIIKYVKGTKNLGVYYSRNSNKNFVAYCDADWEGCADDMKSTMEDDFSRKQSHVLAEQETKFCISLRKKQNISQWGTAAHN
uniref:Reverse transcriptase Ty1/copia-type domain-containing protein n=1 Tax=Brassica oleracea var. oleracea TaxID=109376 RepID=A0A0D3A3D9_BRAOL